MLDALFNFVMSCFNYSRKKVKVIMDKKSTAQEILAAIDKALGAFPRFNYNVLFAS